jgi:hypothetical protein
MKSTTERAAEALDLLPEELREPAVAYLVEQAEKFRVLKTLVAEGMSDIAAGRVSEWNSKNSCARPVRYGRNSRRSR